MDNFKAVQIVEGFHTDPDVEDPNDEDLILEAWQHLIDTGLCWQLQGWFGRTAQRFIDAGICMKADLDSDVPNPRPFAPEDEKYWEPNQ